MSENVRGPTILVVDDEPLVQDLVRDTLEDAGYGVILASSYAEAIAAITTGADEIVGLVTDINLGQPDSGWDVAATARERIPTIPVIYITGDSAHEWPAHGVPHSVIIAKPFAPAQIVVALANLTNVTDPARIPDPN